LTVVNVTGTHALSRQWTLTGNAYLRASDIATYNGDDSDFEGCALFAGFLCEEEDGGEEIVLDPLGAPVPALESLEGATVNRTRTEQDGVGFGLQTEWSGSLGGHD